KKLLFMGGEFGQWQEWKHDQSLDWDLARHGRHASIQRLVGDLNRLYREEPALHRFDCNPAGFEWLETNDWEQSTLAFLRKGMEGDAAIAVACNFTPVPRQNYRIGVPWPGLWHEVLNTDAGEYGGSGQGNFGGVHAVP